jgi:hypothetical protein
MNHGQADRQMATCESQQGMERRRRQRREAQWRASSEYVALTPWHCTPVGQPLVPKNRKRA